MSENKAKLFVVKHPLIEHHMTFLRDKETATAQYRESIKSVTTGLLYEAVGMFPPPQVSLDVLTQDNLTIKSQQLISDEVALVAILRAGVLMAATAHEIFPKAPMMQIGATRDEGGVAQIRYDRLATKLKYKQLYIFDSMIRGGDYASIALEKVKARREAAGHQNPFEGVFFITLTISKKAVARISKLSGSTVPIITASIEDDINPDAENTSTIGDSGGRIYGTSPFN